MSVKVAVALLGLVACFHAGWAGPNPPPPPGKTIIDVLLANDQTWAVQAIAAADMYLEYSDPSKLVTFLAPTENAFRKMFKELGLPQDPSSFGKIPKDVLKTTLLYHTMPYPINTKTMYHNQLLPTLCPIVGSYITVDISGAGKRVVLVGPPPGPNKADVLRADIPTAAGALVDVINAVLTPDFEHASYLPPAYNSPSPDLPIVEPPPPPHVEPSPSPSKGRPPKPQTEPPLAARPDSPPPYAFNYPPAPPTIVPPDNGLLTFIENQPELTYFAQAVKKADLTGLFNTMINSTIFAPDNQAFADAAGTLNNTQGLTPEQMLNRLLLYTIVPQQPLKLADLEEGMELPTFLSLSKPDEILKVTAADNSTATISGYTKSIDKLGNSANTTAPTDLEAPGGNIIQTIDAVLIPTIVDKRKQR